MTNNIWLNLLTSLAIVNKAKFVRQTQNISATQTQFLLNLLRLYQDTKLGKQFDFKSIKTVEQFRSRVPILPYSYYQPYIHRMFQGENNVLTPDPVIYFNFTSGTTAKQKIIPVTKRSRQFSQSTNQVSLSFLVEAVKNKGIPLGKMLLTSSIKIVGHTQTGIPYGPVSVGHLRLNGFIQKQMFVHSYDALKPADSIARHYICLLFALKNPTLRVIGANYPVIALLIAQYLETYADELINDLEKGTIAPWLQLEPELRAKFERRWQAYPQRAKQLREILNSEGRLTPALAWSLGCILTARGGPSRFYLQKFADYFGDTPVFGGIYSSAEAVFGIYQDFDDDGNILTIASNFFEFIPEEEWEKEQPQTLLPQELAAGKQYRIVVSNYTGLYRYDIGDVIQVVGFYHQTPIISFCHRAKGLLSSTTEKTTEFHAIQVMEKLQKEFNLTLENFCVTLSEDNFPPAYLVNIELPPHGDLKEPHKFLEKFDHQLQLMNSCYEIERKGAIPPPRLRILAKNSFAQLTQRLIKQGMPESQVKILHITENRQYLTGLKIEQEFSLNEMD